jgi:hypothetical protein
MPASSIWEYENILQLSFTINHTDNEKNRALYELNPLALHF